MKKLRMWSKSWKKNKKSMANSMGPHCHWQWRMLKWRQYTVLMSLNAVHKLLCIMLDLSARNMQGKLVCLFVCMCARILFRMYEYVYMCTWIQYIRACACTVCVRLYCLCAWIHCANVCEFIPQGWGFSTLESICADGISRATPLAVLWSQRGSRGTDTGIKACLFAFVPLCSGHQRLP